MEVMAHRPIPLRKTRLHDDVPGMPAQTSVPRPNVFHKACAVDRDLLRALLECSLEILPKRTDLSCMFSFVRSHPRARHLCNNIDITVGAVFMSPPITKWASPMVRPGIASELFVSTFSNSFSRWVSRNIRFLRVHAH